VRRGASRRPSRVADRELQVRFLSGLVLVLLFGVFFLYLALYVVFAKPFPAAYAGIFSALRRQADGLALVLGISVAGHAVVVSAAILVLCVLALHRLAGPLSRMERVLDRLEAGDPAAAVFFRRGDQAGGLDRAFNGFLDRLREDRRRGLAILEEAERLCLQDEDTCRSAREDALTRLSELLSCYR
jgi:methyl-accepting chemotaxis protein